MKWSNVSWEFHSFYLLLMCCKLFFCLAVEWFCFSLDLACWLCQRSQASKADCIFHFATWRKSFEPLLSVFSFGHWWASCASTTFKRYAQVLFHSCLPFQLHTDTLIETLKWPKRCWNSARSAVQFIYLPLRSIAALAQTTCPLGEWCVCSHGAHDEAADHPPEGLSFHRFHSEVKTDNKISKDIERASV